MVEWDWMGWYRGIQSHGYPKSSKSLSSFILPWLYNEAYWNPWWLGDPKRFKKPPFFVTSRLHDVTGNDPHMAGIMLYYMEHMGIKERLRRDILWYQSTPNDIPFFCRMNIHLFRLLRYKSPRLAHRIDLDMRFETGDVSHKAWRILCFSDPIPCQKSCVLYFFFPHLWLQKNHKSKLPSINLT